MKLISKVLFTIVNCLALLVLLSQALKDVIGQNTTLIGDVMNCPTWHTFNSSTNECTCQGLSNVVRCNGATATGTVSILYGFCMTYNSDTNQTQVGKCYYTLFSRLNASLYTELPPDPLQLNHFMCSQLHREGYLCNECQDNYGLSVANYFMACVECSLRDGVGWLLFFILQIVPVTVLFVVVITFRLSVTQPPMTGFVLYSQLSLAQIYLNAARFQEPYLTSSTSKVFITLRNIYMPILDVWNLGFFGLIEGPTKFCVNAKLDHQQFYFLTYTTSLHVLLLVVVTFICIELHTRNCRIIVCLWRPFYKCFVRFTRVWDSKRTAIDTFATFLLLSYSRIIVLSYFVYTVQRVYTLDETLKSRIAPLFSPAVSYFHPHHIAYALTSFCLLSAFVLTPAITLALYQTKPFQKCLKCVRLHRCPSLRIFVELFQGCYKDGTNGTRDLRFTSSLYLFIRSGLLVSLSSCGLSDYASCENVTALILLLMALLFIAVAQPYKDNRMNKIDVALLTMLVLTYALLSSIAESTDPVVNAVVLTCVLVLVSIPQLVFCAFIVYKFTNRLSKMRCCQKMCRKFPFHRQPDSRDELTLSQRDSVVFQELSVSRFNTSYEEDSSFSDIFYTAGRTY